MRNAWRLATLCLLSLAGSSCGSWVTPFSTQEPSVARIEIRPATLEMSVGDSQAVAAVLYGSRGRDLGPFYDLTWEVSDWRIASVWERGLNSATVRGLRPGAVTVTARAEGRAGIATVVVR